MKIYQVWKEENTIHNENKNQLSRTDTELTDVRSWR